MMKQFLLFAVASLLDAAASARQYDAYGNDPAAPGGPSGSAPGTVLQSFWGPVVPLSDLAHDGQHLMAISAYDVFATVYLLDDGNGAVAAELPVGTTTDFGLAWDDARELLVLCDGFADVVTTYTRAGALVSSWAYPGTGHVGVAWDCRRDVYWVVDWTTDTLKALDPDTGAIGTTWSAAGVGSTRSAGLGYDANEDVLYVGGRDQVAIFGISAADGSLRCSFAAQGGYNHPQGVAVSPRGGVWHSSWNYYDLFELEGCRPTHPELRLEPNFPVAGGATALTMSRLAAGERAVFAYSLSGCGPTPSPIGDVLLSNPRYVLATVPANGAGIARIGPAVLPGSLAGRRVFLHGGGLDGSGRCNNVVFNP